MTPDLTPYREIIHSLAPIANHSSFNKAFKTRTATVSSELAFLIKMEIKRLAKPCIRSIDLRAIVSDECRIFNYQGIPHYLHVNGILEFEKLVKRYGEYTFGVYEEVINFAQEEKKRLEQLKVNVPVVKAREIEIPADKFVTPCQTLLNYPSRKEERLNYVVAIEVFFKDNSSAQATTLDISVSGLKIRLKDPKQLEKVSVNDPAYIIFRGLQRTTGLTKDDIEYVVLGFSGKGSKTCLHLTRAPHSLHPQFDEFVSNLIKTQKRRYKVNLDNVEMALGSKVYEQSFSNNTPNLPIFITQDKSGHLVASYSSTNGFAKRILDYWLDESHKQMIGYLVNPKRIEQLQSNPNEVSETTVFCFNHVDDEKIYFYSATLDELKEQPKLAETFLGYAARRVSWRVFHLTHQAIDSSCSYTPTSLPNGITREIDRLNRPHTPRLKGRLQKISALVTVSDITNHFGQEVYQRRKLDKQSIRLLKYFGHPRNKPPEHIEAFRNKQQELRRQTRYILRTPVIIETQNRLIKGVTEDFSISGLRLELEEEFPHRQNSKVSISFPKLQEITDEFNLKGLQYRVRHVNSERQVLHLQAMAIDETDIAEQFFRQLIANNEDRLQALEEQEKIPGMSIALRNLHSKQTQQLCIYIEKKQNGFVPAMVTSNQPAHQFPEFIKDNKHVTSLDLSFMFQDDELSTAFVKQSVKMMAIDPKPVQTELFVCVQQDGNKNHVVTAKWGYQLTNHKLKRSFIQQSLKHQFYAFSVTINKAMRPDLEQLEQELIYLSQHAIHKATHFEESMWDIAATIFTTDITEEMLYRYRLQH